MRPHLPHAHSVQADSVPSRVPRRAARLELTSTPVTATKTNSYAPDANLAHQSERDCISTPQTRLISMARDRFSPRLTGPPVEHDLFS